MSSHPAEHDVLCDVARAAGLVGNYCDHAEHNEVTERKWVLDAGRMLIDCAHRYAASLDVSISELYAARLAQIESANVAYFDGDYDGAASARAAKSWRELQLVQIAHDAAYHRDVTGLSRLDQLRHYAFHVAKLAAACAGRLQHRTSDDEFRDRRLPDLLLFGIKLHTVMAERMPATTIDHPPEY